MKKERTLLNWLKWNLRGRPYELIVETANGGHGGKMVENNVYVPDYLVDQYWRMRNPSHPNYYQM